MITGATGTIGVEVSRYLINKHSLTLVAQDFSTLPKELADRSTLVTADLTEPDNWEGVLDDIEYIIQFAGQADQNAEFYSSLLDLNYKVPHNLYQAAMHAPKLKRVIVASSIHAVDAYPENTQVKVTDPIRPKNLYGVSKVYIEALATYHAYVNGIESIAIRIADYKASDDELEPDADKNGMAMYLSKRDMNHLIDCCLNAELQEPFLLVNGISNNTFPRLSIDEARVKLNYQPQDNAFEKNHIFE